MTRVNWRGRVSNSTPRLEHHWPRSRRLVQRGEGPSLRHRGCVLAGSAVQAQREEDEPSAVSRLRHALHCRPVHSSPVCCLSCMVVSPPSFIVANGGSCSGYAGSEGERCQILLSTELSSSWAESPCTSPHTYLSICGRSNSLCIPL